MTDKQMKAINMLSYGQSLWVDCLNGWYLVGDFGLTFYDKDEKAEYEAECRKCESFLQTAS